ncbi:MAG: hypothetical protein ACHQJ6_06695, partial [Candidatus Berkiellales bacterium]
MKTGPGKKASKENEDKSVVPDTAYQLAFHKAVETAKDGIAFLPTWNKTLKDRIKPADLVKKITVTDAPSREQTALGLLADVAAKGHSELFLGAWAWPEFRPTLSDVTPAILDSLLNATRIDSQPRPKPVVTVLTHLDDKIRYSDRYFFLCIVALLKEVSTWNDLNALWNIFINILEKKEENEEDKEEEKE